MQKISQLAAIGVLLMIFLLTFTHSRDFDQDLGRHIALGKIMLKTRSIPDTNLFSYTNPDYPFINHHWGAEIIIALIFTLAPALIVWVKALLITASVAGALIIGATTGSSLIAPLFVTFITSPLLLERSTFRPELFGYGFFTLILFQFIRYPKNQKMLPIAIPIMILWTNIHITFVFGIFLLGILGLRTLSEKSISQKEKVRDFVMVITAGLSGLLNPQGLKGFLYPFSIFDNYGYQIVENQNMFFLKSFAANPLISWYFLIAPVTVISIIILFAKKKVLYATTLSVFFIAPIMQIRHLPFFIFSSIPLSSIAIVSVLPKKIRADNIRMIVLILLTVGILFGTISAVKSMYALVFDTHAYFGGTIIESAQEGTDYILEHNLPGAIFNNFDIGGYAIYRLYPKYRVFIDNRPEAYPADFISETYIPMQFEETIRQSVFNAYQIKTIFFSHTDQTPWATAFLEQIATKSDWKIVYLDTAVIILTNEKNAIDIRTNTTHLTNRIYHARNSLELLQFARILAIVGRADLSQFALETAGNMNPLSCALSKIRIQNIGRKNGRTPAYPPRYCY